MVLVWGDIDETEGAVFVRGDNLTIARNGIPQVNGGLANGSTGLVCDDALQGPRVPEGLSDQIRRGEDGPSGQD